MKEYTFCVGRGDGGKRLDQFLVKKLPRWVSRSLIQRLNRDKHVLLDNKPVKVHHKVREGEKISVRIPPKEPMAAKAEEIPINIVYRDDSVVVVDKPAGIVVHPAAGNYSGTLVNALLHRFKKLATLGGPARPGIVHRLDKDTSGLMVVARTDEAYTGLAKQFRKRTIKRKYLALVKGVVEFDEGVIDFRIGRHPRKRKQMDVTFTGGKVAKTSYKVIERFNDFTLLELTLGTGRTHQIRVHLAHIGHPVLGDATYGSRERIGRQALHAASLGFRHPQTAKFMKFESKLPEDMKQVMKARSG